MQLEIKFHDNPKGYYNAGETVVGCVIATFPVKLSIKGIAFKVSGFGESKWTPDRRRKPKVEQYFHGREDYLSTVNYFIGSEDSLLIDIPLGRSFYDFQFTIPKTCPSSFDGEFGHITYETSVEIISPANPGKHTERFTVYNVTDVDIRAVNLMVPINMESTRSFCCGSGCVNLFLDIPKSGFVPGEVVPLSVKVENNAGVFFKSATFSFSQLVQYTSNQPKVQMKTSVFHLTDKNLIMSGAASRTMETTIATPQATPSSETLSKVIKISYEISILIETTKRKTIRTSVPVTIGYDPVEIVEQASKDTVDIQSNASSSIRYEEPLFMKTVDVSDGGKHSKGKSPFKPKYPVFEMGEIDQTIEDLDRELEEH